MIQSIALIAGTAALLLVIAELVARAVIRERDQWFVHAPHSRAEYVLDAEAFPRLPPVVRRAANSDGERGSALPRPPEDLYRVLIAGGSAAECYMLDQHQSWPMVTQDLLNTTAGRRRLAHVGNVACSLIPCRTIDRLLKRMLHRLDALDVIVLMVGASDLVDWFEKKTPPALDESPSELHLYCAEHPAGGFRWTPTGCALYRVGKRLRVRLLRPVDRRSRVGAARVKHRQMRAEAERILREAPDPSPMLDGFRHHLTQLIRTCKEHAGEVLLARQPWLDSELSEEEQKQLWNFGQGRPYKQKPEAYYSISLVRELMERVDEVAEEVARREGVPQLDLRARVPSDLDHYYDFLHHTPLGARCVGVAVADKLADLERDQPN